MVKSPFPTKPPWDHKRIPWSMAEGRREPHRSPATQPGTPARRRRAAQSARGAAEPSWRTRRGRRSGSKMPGKSCIVQPYLPKLMGNQDRKARYLGWRSGHGTSLRFRSIHRWGLPPDRSNPHGDKMFQQPIGDCVRGQHSTAQHYQNNHGSPNIMGKQRAPCY